MFLIDVGFSRIDFNVSGLVTTDIIMMKVVNGNILGALSHYVFGANRNDAILSHLRWRDRV